MNAAGGAMRNLSPAKVFSEDQLREAWDHVRKHSKAAGPDGFSPADFERNDTHWLRKMRAELVRGDYLFGPLKLVMVPKSDGGTRWIGIPDVRDRIAGRALALALTDRVDRRFHASSFAYRPRRGVREAVAKVTPRGGRDYVARFDIAKCFDTIAPETAVAALEPVEGWVRDMALQAVTVGMGRDGDFRRPRGIPQGSALSPLLCNCVLDGLDRALARLEPRYVRYADDMAACCKSFEGAEAVMDEARRVLAGLDMALNERKCGVATFQHGFRYLGTWFQGSFAFPQLEVVRDGRKVRVSGYEGDSEYAVADWGEDRRRTRWV